MKERPRIIVSSRSAPLLSADKDGNLPEIDRAIPQVFGSTGRCIEGVLPGLIEPTRLESASFYRLILSFVRVRNMVPPKIAWLGDPPAGIGRLLRRLPVARFRCCTEGAAEGGE